MPTELENYLVHGPKLQKISSDTLELLGKQAANMFLDDNINLNDAVIKVASIYPDINQEQLKRICETANTEVFLAKHEKDKTSGASHSYPQFHIADPDRVCKNINSGASPAITKTSSDYSSPPKHKTAKAEASIFPEAKEYKTYSDNNIADDLLSIKQAASDLYNHLTSSAEKLDSMYQEATEEFYSLAKNHLLEEGQFSDIMTVARSVAKEKTAEVMLPFVTRLISEKVASPEKLSFTKLANRIVNHEHPMVMSLKEIITLESEIEKVAIARETTKAELKEINDLIKEVFL